jgi:heme oxygenase
MSKLKELTWESHKRAERSGFMHRMIKKQMTPYQYYVYLANQLLCYWELESYAKELDIFDGIEDLIRSNYITKDMQELEILHGFELPVHLVSTSKYIAHIQSISEDPAKLLAHIYVRHMGDLSGGQIIKKYIPGSGLYYKFEEEPEILKNKLRTKLNDDMADEANICFNLVFDVLQELEIYFADMGSTD